MPASLQAGSDVNWTVTMAVETFALKGRLLVEEGLGPGFVVVEGDRIAGVTSGAPPRVATVYEADSVVPGFIDLQVNGGFGADVAAGREAIQKLARELPKTGVTAFLPTLISSP